VIARPDRDEVRDEIRDLFEVNAQAEAEPSPTHRTAAATRLRPPHRAGKGPEKAASFAHEIRSLPDDGPKDVDLPGL
jgi:hypothetical protein